MNDPKLWIRGGAHKNEKCLLFKNFQAIVPMLINGTKESNSAVRTTCELGLVDVFRLRQSKSSYDNYLSNIEGAAKDVLSEVYKTLSRIAKQSAQQPESLVNFPSVP